MCSYLIYLYQFINSANPVIISNSIIPLSHLPDTFSWFPKYALEEVELVGLCTDICVISNALILKAAYPEIKVTVDAGYGSGYLKLLKLLRHPEVTVLYIFRYFSHEQSLTFLLSTPLPETGWVCYEIYLV